VVVLLLCRRLFVLAGFAFLVLFLFGLGLVFSSFDLVLSGLLLGCVGLVLFLLGM